MLNIQMRISQTALFVHDAFGNVDGELFTPFIRQQSYFFYYRYYDQLCALETKIMVQDFQVPFKWKDAFDKGSIFGGRMSLSEYCLHFFVKFIASVTVLCREGCLMF